MTYAARSRSRDAARLGAAGPGARARGPRLPPCSRCVHAARWRAGEDLARRVCDATGEPGTLRVVAGKLVARAASRRSPSCSCNARAGERLARRNFSAAGRCRPALASLERAGDRAARRGHARRARRRRREPRRGVRARRGRRRHAPRAALIDLTHGTLRRYGRVQAIVRRAFHRGARRRDRRGAALVLTLRARVGTLRRLHRRRSGGARLRALERWSAKGYVNALLRSYLRERASLEARIQADPEARYQHPRWWIELLRAGLPRAVERGPRRRQHASADELRVNRRRSPRASTSAS